MEGEPWAFERSRVSRANAQATDGLGRYASKAGTAKRRGGSEESAVCGPNDGKTLRGKETAKFSLCLLCASASFSLLVAAKLEPGPRGRQVSGQDAGRVGERPFVKGSHGSAHAGRTLVVRGERQRSHGRRAIAVRSGMATKSDVPTSGAAIVASKPSTLLPTTGDAKAGAY
jgi:hypothetical protein